MTSYYRTSGSTSRAKCDNCKRPFKEHRLAGVDRDGELHACPPVGLDDKAKNALAAKEAIRCLDAVSESVLQHFDLGKFACKKKLANGAVLQVILTMPPLKGKPRRKARKR